MAQLDSNQVCQIYEQFYIFPGIACDAALPLVRYFVGIGAVSDASVTITVLFLYQLFISFFFIRGGIISEYHPYGT